MKRNNKKMNYYVIELNKRKKPLITSDEVANKLKENFNVYKFIKI